MDPSLIGVRRDVPQPPPPALPVPINQSTSGTTTCDVAMEAGAIALVDMLHGNNDHRYKQLPLKKRKNVVDESASAGKKKASSGKKTKQVINSVDGSTSGSNGGTSEPTRSGSKVSKKHTVTPMQKTKYVSETGASIRQPLVTKEVPHENSNYSSKTPNTKKKKNEEGKNLQKIVSHQKELSVKNHIPITTSNTPSMTTTATIDLTTEGTTPNQKARKDSPKQKSTTEPPKHKAGTEPPKQKETKELPKKKKRKKLSFEGQILRVLFQSCKPYNVKGLTEAVECASPSALEFALMSLMDKKLVLKKEFPAKKEGREPKVLYWGNLDMQHHKDAKLCLGESCTEEEIICAEDDNQTLTRKLQALGQTIHLLESQPTTSDLETQLGTLEVELNTLRSRIQTAKDYKKEMISKKKSTATTTPHPNKLKKRINYHRDEWKSRKEKTVDFVENLADAMEKKIQNVYDMLDIETDEMVSVQMPKKHDIR